MTSPLVFTKKDYVREFPPGLASPPSRKIDFHSHHLTTVTSPALTTTSSKVGPPDTTTSE
jgi:hypothetical protein